MKGKRQHAFFLNDILRAIQDIEKFTSGLSEKQFLQDEKTRSAVYWQIGIIGEAAKHIPINIRRKYKRVPWSELAKMRDKITHGYFGIRYEIVWKVIKERLPDLKFDITNILKEESENDLFIG